MQNYFFWIRQQVIQSLFNVNEMLYLSDHTGKIQGQSCRLLTFANIISCKFLLPASGNFHNLSGGKILCRRGKDLPASMPQAGSFRFGEDAFPANHELTHILHLSIHNDTLH
jgi:hypothetical protein